MRMRMITLVTILSALAAVCLAPLPAQADRVATEAEIAENLNGTWKGYFINGDGDEFPMTFHVEVSGNKVKGKAEIPDSSSDTNPSFEGSLSGRYVKWSTSSGFDYMLRMTTDGDGNYRLSGGVTGTNDGEADLKRKGAKIGSGDPYKDAWALMSKATAERCDCFLEKYAPAEFTKAYAISKDGAYGARWKNGMAIEDARNAALESCRKKDKYNPANPCVIFMENDKVVWKP